MPDIYLLIEGKQEGPYTEDQVQQSLAEGLFHADLPAWYEGLPTWVEVGSLIGGLSDAASVPASRNSTHDPLPFISDSLPNSLSPGIQTHSTEPLSKQRMAVVGAMVLAGVILFGLSVGAGFALVQSHKISNATTTAVVTVPNNAEATKTPGEALSLSALDADLLASLASNSKAPVLTFPQLWGDAESYFNVPFIVHGKVRLPHSPPLLLGDAESYQTDAYRQVVIMSLDKSPDGIDDIVFCFVKKETAEQLISLLSSDESKQYNGYFLLYIPNAFKDVGQYKKTQGDVDTQREIMCEMIGYGPNLISLDAAER
jgi:hypothetical protein